MVAFFPLLLCVTLYAYNLHFTYMYMCIYLCKHTFFIHVYMYIFMYYIFHTCVYAHNSFKHTFFIHAYIHTHRVIHILAHKCSPSSLFLTSGTLNLQGVCVCMYVCMHACAYVVRVHFYTCMHVFVHTYAQDAPLSARSSIYRTHAYTISVMSLHMHVVYARTCWHYLLHVRVQEQAWAHRLCTCSIRIYAHIKPPQTKQFIHIYITSLHESIPKIMRSTYCSPRPVCWGS